MRPTGQISTAESAE